MDMQDYKYVNIGDNSYKMFYDIEEAKEDFIYRYKKELNLEIYKELPCVLLVSPDEENAIYRIESEATCDYTLPDEAIKTIETIFGKIDSHIS